MSELPVYRMSESGACPKLLAAMHLKYDFPPDTPGTMRIFKEGHRHEIHVAEDITAEDRLRLVDAKTCGDCLVETGEIKDGHHVEFSTFLARLVGHIDRMVVSSSGTKFPVEIKALGKFRFEQFKRGYFKDFAEYEAQECCYLHCCKSPGLYVVKSRDTGELLKLDIGYNGDFVDLPGYIKVHLSIPIDSVLDNIHTAELAVQENKLPEVECEENKRRWCKAKFLCSPKGEKSSAVEVVTSEVVALSEVAALWREGKEYERMGKESLESAKTQFLAHAQANKLSKFQVGGLSVGYYGARQRDYLSEEKLKVLLTPEMLKQVYVPGKPFEDIRIREA